MAPGEAELRRIGRTTIGHYARVAHAYRDAVWHHDVSQNVAALLQAIEGPPPHRILDLGCGPGRDLITFRDQGHEVIGLEGCGELAAMARAAAGCEVWEQDLLALDLPPAAFDGIFANAVLFHVPSLALPRMLESLAATLRPGGVLLCSNPRGAGEEGWAGDRWACFWDLPGWRRVVSAAGFTPIHHYFRPPGKPRAQQPWLVTLWRRPKGPEAEGTREA
jgi:SAM-dependent methyltransferase